MQGEKVFQTLDYPDKNSQKIMRERGQEMVEWRGKRHWPSSFISLEKRAGRLHSTISNHFHHSTSHNRFEFALPFATGTGMCQVSLSPAMASSHPPHLHQLLLSLHETGGSWPGGELAEVGMQPQLSSPRSSVPASYPLKPLTCTTGTQPWAEGKVLKAHRQPQLSPL